MSNIDTFNHKTKFYDAWRSLGTQLSSLCEFVGGLASVFPGTSTVEADFSLIRFEKMITEGALPIFLLTLQAVL